MFEDRGIEHLELYFDDGTNPTDEIIREFIHRSEEVFDKGGSIAIHVRYVLYQSPVFHLPILPS